MVAPSLGATLAAISTDDLLAFKFTVSTASLSELQKAQRVILHYDEQGHLQKYDLN